MDRLLKARFIREVHYPKWLAKVIIVQKPNKKCRMCVNFTDLNKSCPKDSFPLPRIDTRVDLMDEHQTLSFMDTFSGVYNQIKMHGPDQEKTTFINDQGHYYYRVIPFGLKI